MESMRKTAGVISRVGLQGWLHSSPVELAFSACFSFYTKDTGTHKTAGPMLAMTWNEVTVSTFVQHRVMPCQPLFTQANSVFSSTAFPPVKNLVTAESLLCKGIWEMWFFLCSIWLLDGSGKKKKKLEQMQNKSVFSVTSSLPLSEQSPWQLKKGYFGESLLESGVGGDV